MCEETTIWYPCREHAAMRTTTKWCSGSRVSNMRCRRVIDKDGSISRDRRLCLHEPCPVRGCSSKKLGLSAWLALLGKKGYHAIKEKVEMHLNKLARAFR